MFQKLFFACFFVFALTSVLFAQTNCPPATLQSNPQPVTGGGSSCIAEADWVNLDLNETWSRKVHLKGGQSYWFAASKCARAYSIAGEVKDDRGNILKSDRGSSVGFCFRAPMTGTYTVSYRVTELRGSYSFAITNACLSVSNCSP